MTTVNSGLSRACVSYLMFMTLNKRGYIPSEAPSILLRLGVHPDNWLDALPKLEEQFHEFMGREDSMQRLGEKLEKKWLKGVGLARRLFGGAESGVGSVI